jgi:hypothetical protein
VFGERPVPPPLQNLQHRPARVKHFETPGMGIY